MYNDYDYEFYRGVNKEEMLASIKKGTLTKKSKVPFYEDNEVMEMVYGDLSDKKYEKIIKKLIPWNPKKGGINLTTDFENSVGYGDYVLCIEETGEVAYLESFPYAVAENPLECKIDSAYDVNEQQYYSLEEAQKKYLGKNKKKLKEEYIIDEEEKQKIKAHLKEIIYDILDKVIPVHKMEVVVDPEIKSYLSMDNDNGLWLLEYESENGDFSVEGTKDEIKKEIDYILKNICRKTFHMDESLLKENKNMNNRVASLIDWMINAWEELGPEDSEEEQVQDIVNLGFSKEYAKNVWDEYWRLDASLRFKYTEKEWHRFLFLIDEDEFGIVYEMPDMIFENKKIKRIKRLIESLSKEEIEKLSYLLQDDSYLNRGSYMTRDLIKNKKEESFKNDDRVFEVKVYDEDKKIISFEKVYADELLKMNIGVDKELIDSLDIGDGYGNDGIDPIDFEIKRIS